MEAQFEKNRKIKTSCILQQMLLLELVRAKKRKTQWFIGKTLVLATHRNCRTKKSKALNSEAARKP
jgi:hypothetical protein